MMISNLTFDEATKQAYVYANKDNTTYVVTKQDSYGIMPITHLTNKVEIVKTITPLKGEQDNMKESTLKLIKISAELRKKIPRSNKAGRTYRANLLRENYHNGIRRLYLTRIVLEGGCW